MKKKFIFFLLMTIILITGCGSNNQNKVLKKVKNNIEKHEKYELKADLELMGMSFHARIDA